MYICAEQPALQTADGVVGLVALQEPRLMYPRQADIRMIILTQSQQ